MTTWAQELRLPCRPPARFPVITVMRIFLLLLIVAAANAQQTKLTNLPEAVRKTVQAQTQGAQIKTITKEKDGGKTFYEVETTVSGKARDFLVDASGNLAEVEEATELSAMPPPARVAIEKWAAGVKLSTVETVTKGSAGRYEASIVKGGKERAIAVKADGTVQK